MGNIPKFRVVCGIRVFNSKGFQEKTGNLSETVEVGTKVAIDY